MKKVYLLLSVLMLFTRVNGQDITIDRQVSMLALGDSYTIGQSVDINERWPHQFTDELRKLGVEAEYPDYIATTGWTTRRLIQGINTMTDPDKRYNLVSILIGVNNQYQGIDISTYEPDLRDIIDLALNIVDQDTSRVFILSIPDYAYTPFGGGFESISKEIDDYNNIKRRIAVEYGIPYIDITPISRNGLNDPSLVAGDGLHPSGKQYGQWVQAIIPHLKLDISLSDHVHTESTLDYVRLYPNPAGSVLHLESSMEIKRIRIFDLKGSPVADQQVNSVPVHIDLSQFSSGMYTLCAFPANQLNRVSRNTFIVQ